MAKAKVNPDACIGCGICILSCPEPMAIRLREDGKIEIDPKRCKACYLCVEACPKKALEPDEDDAK